MTFKETFKGNAEVIGCGKVSFITKIKFDDNFKANVLDDEEYLDGYDVTRRMQFLRVFLRKRDRPFGGSEIINYLLIT